MQIRWRGPDNDWLMDEIVELIHWFADAQFTEWVSLILWKVIIMTFFDFGQFCLCKSPKFSREKALLRNSWYCALEIPIRITDYWTIHLLIPNVILTNNQNSTSICLYRIPNFRSIPQWFSSLSPVHIPSQVASWYCSIGQCARVEERLKGWKMDYLVIMFINWTPSNGILNYGSVQSSELLESCVLDTEDRLILLKNVKHIWTSNFRWSWYGDFDSKWCGEPPFYQAYSKLL